MTIEKYVNNITSQHRDKPKFISWIKKSLTVLDHAYHGTKSIDINFDLDNAIGRQLDVLGSIVGAERTLKYQPREGYNPVLDDETYRLVLKAKVATNMWDGTTPHIYEIWENIFSDLTLAIEDHQDMSFYAYIDGDISQIRLDLVQKGYIIPKPQGVRIYYVLGMPRNNINVENKNYTFDVPYMVCNTFNTADIDGGLCKKPVNLGLKTYAVDVNYPVCNLFKTSKTSFEKAENEVLFKTNHRDNEVLFKRAGDVTAGEGDI